MRKIPKYPETLPDASPPEGFVPKEYPIQVITPLFGGGVEAGNVDPAMPIRPSSIRGHLRFWWRVTRGAKFPSVDEMRQREEEIWGGMENPSPVIIEVEQPEIDPNKDIRSPKGVGVNRFGPDGYALFSAEENSLLFKPEGISFKLTVSWLKSGKLQELRDKENEKLRHLNKPQKNAKIEGIDDDVREALCAWVNFGGIGARTRRGCGALYCELLAIDTEDDLKKYPFKFFIKDRNRPDNTERTSKDAWEQSIEPLRKFRQTFRTNRHNKKMRSRRGIEPRMVPGRSLWPEPDSIRKITGCALKPPNLNNFDHSNPVTPTGYFPRAEFGLPIVFHFADGPGKRERPSKDLDPPDAMLIPTTPGGKDGSRMASPVITRPFKFKNGSFIPLIILLPQNELPNLRLIVNCRKLPHDMLRYDIKADAVRNPDLTKYPNSPMGKSSSTKTVRSQNGSALEAFIEYIQEEEQGFTMVPP